jgi:hypothetical protein
MNLIALAFLAALALVPAQDDEAKKKRLGELVKQMGEIQQEAEKLLEDLSGGDRSKKDAIMMEVMRKHAPKMAGQMESAVRGANERNASASLKTLASAQADFRANDRDNNRMNDFWAGDVSGLYRVDPSDGGIRLIEISVALADARPCVPLDKQGTFGAMKIIALGKTAPKAGYWFASVPKFQNDDGATEKYDDGFGRCAARFAHCAYPAAYGEAGKHTFLITEENTIWKKDTGGKPVDLVPADLRAQGWTRLD